MASPTTLAEPVKIRSYSTNFILPTHHRETIHHSHGDTEIIWQPSIAIDSNGSIIGPSADRGIVLLFHGCGGTAETWFTLSEHRANVKALVTNGFAVIAFTSSSQVRKCWDETWPLEYEAGTSTSSSSSSSSSSSLTVNHDVTNVVATLRQWLERESKSALALFAFGASSGGTFVTLLARSMYLNGIVVMISPGHGEALLTRPMMEYETYRKELLQPSTLELDSTRLNSYQRLANLPPIAFIYMPRDTNWAGDGPIRYFRSAIQRSNPWLDSSSSSSSFDLLPLFPVAPRPWRIDSLMAIDEFRTNASVGGACSELVYTIGHMTSNTDLQQQSDEGLLFNRSTHDIIHDPRRTQPVKVIQQILDQLIRGTITLNDSSLAFKANPSQSADILFHSCRHLVHQYSASLKELFNSYYAYHEMTSAYTNEMVDWMVRLLLSDAELKRAQG